MVASLACSCSCDIDGKDEKKLLVLYIGGTIGMQPNQDGVLAPAPNTFISVLRTYNQMHDEAYYKSRFNERDSQNVLVLPLTAKNQRIVYCVKEYETLLDSCNMGIQHWEKLALDIKEFYEDYNGFVIVQGTDTLAYTSSALSFMLRNLGKPVIVTGAQIPIFNIRSDGINNMLNSLILAASFNIPEVTVFFGGRLMRGNRTTKFSTISLDGFYSPNMEPLVTVGLEYAFKIPTYGLRSESEFFTRTGFSKNVVILTIFPEIPEKVVRCFFDYPTEGVVLLTFGAGNVPSNRPDVIDIIKKANDRGVLVVNCSQCLNGAVKSIYETNKVLADAGVISGCDMTTESAFVKLQYVLSMNLSFPDKKKIMQKNLRGELTEEESLCDVKLEEC